jgi:hypothetical protein
MTRTIAAGCLVLVVVAALVGCSTAAPVAVWSTPATTMAPVATPTPTPAPAPVHRKTPVPVAIFGDSQATALYRTRPLSVDQSLQLTDGSISACGILRGDVTSRSGERFDLVSACPNWLPFWRGRAQRDRPAIALVVIGAWEVFDLNTPQGTLTWGTPQWDATFLDTLRSGLAALRESGAQVALAELPCYRPHRENPKPPGYWPERGDDARTRHVNDLLRQAADGVHVFTVTPPGAFCTNPKVADNATNRYDGVHYLQPGASLWFNAVIPQLLTLPT